MTIETPATPPHAPERPRRRGAAFAVSTITLVVGSCIALGTLAATGASAVSVIRDDGRSASAFDSPARGLTELDVDVTGGRLSIAYGDVSDARLDARSGRRGWTFERRGDTLRVASPNGALFDGAAGSRATLTLPRELEGADLDADIQVSGGALDLEGDFGAVTVQIAGGTMALDGAVTDADVSISGGSASAQLTDVTTAAFEVAGGELTATLSGDTPSRTEIEVAAGSAELTLPDDEYRVRVDDGLGTVDNALRTSASATAEVNVTATMGQVRLRS